MMSYGPTVIAHLAAQANAGWDGRWPTANSSSPNGRDTATQEVSAKKEKLAGLRRKVREAEESWRIAEETLRSEHREAQREGKQGLWEDRWGATAETEARDKRRELKETREELARISESVLVEEENPNLVWVSVVVAEGGKILLDEKLRTDSTLAAKYLKQNIIGELVHAGKIADIRDLDITILSATPMNNTERMIGCDRRNGPKDETGRECKGGG